MPASKEKNLVGPVYVKRNIIYKSEVNQSLRNLVEKETNEAVDQCQNNIIQLQDLMNKEELKDKDKEGLTEQINKFKVQVAYMKNKLTELESLNDGDWYIHNAIEGFATLEKGDNIREKLMDIEVCCKDNIIQEITSTFNVVKPTAKQLPGVVH